MADEYIRKQDAVNAINEALKRVFTEHVGEGIINPLEPADVVPVVRGRWIDDGTEFGCQCSECGKSLDDYVAPTEYASLNEIPNFCPNCGADMRGKQNE